MILVSLEVKERKVGTLNQVRQHFCQSFTLLVIGLLRRVILLAAELCELFTISLISSKFYSSNIWITALFIPSHISPMSYPSTPKQKVAALRITF